MVQKQIGVMKIERRITRRVVGTNSRARSFVTILPWNWPRILLLFFYIPLFRRLVYRLCVLRQSCTVNPVLPRPGSTVSLRRFDSRGGNAGRCSFYLQNQPRERKLADLRAASAHARSGTHRLEMLAHRRPWRSSLSTCR